MTSDFLKSPKNYELDDATCSEAIADNNNDNVYQDVTNAAGAPLSSLTPPFLSPSSITPTVSLSTTLPNNQDDIVGITVLDEDSANMPNVKDITTIT